MKWQKSYKKDFGGQPGGWAYTESPLVDGDWVLGTPGGKSATMSHSRRRPAKWSGSRALAGIERKPVPPDARTRRRRILRIFASGLFVVVVATDRRREAIRAIPQRRRRRRRRQGPASCSGTTKSRPTPPPTFSTPISNDDSVFAASSYGPAAAWPRSSRTATASRPSSSTSSRRCRITTAASCWSKDHLYGNDQHGTVVHRLQDGQGGVARTLGRQRFGHLRRRPAVFRGEERHSRLVEANPAKTLRQALHAARPNRRQGSRPHPVVANGKLYLRDWDILLCYRREG